MKVLLTGATGFIGKHLVSGLLAGGHSVIAIVRPESDVTLLKKNNISFFRYTANYQELCNYINKEQPEGIVHLASMVLGDHKSEQISELIHSNVLFPTHLIDAAANSGTRWFINTGTYWQHYEGKEYSPVNLYAASKQAFEDFARYYFESTNINFVTFKLYDTFGPDDTRPKIFNLWLKSALSGELLEMSAGEQVIDVSYIDNITEGYLALMQLLSNDADNRFSGRTFALKAEKRMSLRALAELFENVTGMKLNIAWGKKTYRPREVMLPWQEAENIPGFQPRISLEEGIKLFYKIQRKPNNLSD